MSFLVQSLPPIQCFVRKEFLYDFEMCHNELEPCVWVSLKSIAGQAFRIESYLPNYGALYDKLPLHAYQWKKEVTNPLPLDHLQIWDCPGYYFTIQRKRLFYGISCEFLAKDKNMYSGEYMFTVDHCEPDDSILDTSWNHTPEQHKSFNFIQMDNGQYAAQPNNRMRFNIYSLTPEKLKFPDFKACTKTYSVEKNQKWNLGDTDDVMYLNKKTGA